MKKYYILVLCLISASCNKAFMTNKKDIVYTKKGYIVLFYDKEESIFFPESDTVDEHFLKKDHQNGFKISGTNVEIQDLKRFALTNSIQYNKVTNGQVSEINGSIKLLPVVLKYYWGSAWDQKKLNTEENMIRYIFNRKPIVLSYLIYDYRTILSIAPARETDKARIEVEASNTLH